MVSTLADEENEKWCMTGEVETGCREEGGQRAKQKRRGTRSAEEETCSSSKAVWGRVLGYVAGSAKGSLHPGCSLGWVMRSCELLVRRTGVGPILGDKTNQHVHHSDDCRHEMEKEQLRAQEHL